jgi:hypothetical protein
MIPKKRICDLQEGDVFLRNGYTCIVIGIDDNFIRYSINRNRYGSVGKKSQEYVEIKEIVEKEKYTCLWEKVAECIKNDFKTMNQIRNELGFYVDHSVLHTVRKRYNVLTIKHASNILKYKIE